MNLSSLGPDQIQLNHGLQLLAIKVGKVYIHFVVGKFLTRKTKHSHLKLSKVNQTKTSFQSILFTQTTLTPFIAVLSLYHLHRYLHSIALFQTQSRQRLHLKCTLPLLSVHFLNHPRPLFPFPCFRCKFPHRQLPLPLRAPPVWIWTYLRGLPEATSS